MFRPMSKLNHTINNTSEDDRYGKRNLENEDPDQVLFHSFHHRVNSPQSSLDMNPKSAFANYHSD